MVTPYRRSKNRKRNNRETSSDDDSMPDRSRLMPKKSSMKTPIVQELDDDIYVLSDSSLSPQISMPSLTPSYATKIEEEDEDDVKPGAFINQDPMANVVSSMLGMMQSQTEMMLGLARNPANPAIQPAPQQPMIQNHPQNEDETTNARDFLNHLQMYVNSLNSGHLNSLQTTIDRKIDILGRKDPRIPIDKFRLAIEAAVGIIIA